MSPRTDDQPGRIDARSAAIEPAQFSEILHFSGAVIKGVPSAAGEIRSAGDLSAIVYAAGIAVRAAERSQIDHLAAAPENGIVVAIALVRATNDQPRGADADCTAEDSTIKNTQIVQRVILSGHRPDCPDRQRNDNE